MSEIRDKEQAISRLQEIGRNMQAYCEDMRNTKFGCRSCIFHDFVCDLGNAGLKIHHAIGDLHGFNKFDDVLRYQTIDMIDEFKGKIRDHINRDIAKGEITLICNYNLYDLFLRIFTINYAAPAINNIPIDICKNIIDEKENAKCGWLIWENEKHDLLQDRIGLVFFVKDDMQIVKINDTDLTQFIKQDDNDNE